MEKPPLNQEQCGQALIIFRKCADAAQTNRAGFAQIDASLDLFERLIAAHFPAPANVSALPTEKPATNAPL